MKLELTATSAAEICGISLQAFARWKLKPARKRGREVFYFWDDVRKMRDLKRSLRTRPDSRDVNPEGGLTSVQRLAGSIGDEAEDALNCGDLVELRRQLSRMKALTLACGIDENALGTELDV